jgi:NitT/TauT family transport system permease protein/taurine transport system permease protein
LTQWLGIISANRFPTPADTWASLKTIALRGYGNGKLHQHILQSVGLVTTAFLVSAAAGVLLGIIMGANRKIEAIVNPIFLTLRPIPPLAWIPLAIVWLGLGNSAKVMVIFVAAFVPSVINTFTGIRSLDNAQREAALMLGVSRFSYYTEVLIPTAMPLIFSGLRLSLQASWTTLVAAELVGAVLGLGSILNQAAQDINPAMILVGMISVAVCGWLMTQLLGYLEKFAMPWRHS